MAAVVATWTTHQPRWKSMSHTRRVVTVCAVMMSAALAAAAEVTFEQRAINARAALDTSRCEQALVVFERAAAQAPDRRDEIAFDWAWTHVKLGEIKRKSDRPFRADEHFTKALEIHPEIKAIILPRVLHCRDTVLYRLIEAGDDSFGDAYWVSLSEKARAALELAPGCLRVRYRLAVVLRRQGGQKGQEEAHREYLKVLGGKTPRDRSLSGLHKAAWQRAKKETFKFEPLVHPMQLECKPGGYMIHHWGPFAIHHHNKELAERLGRALLYHANQPVLDGLLPGGELEGGSFKIYVYRNRAEVAGPPDTPDRQAYARPMAGRLIYTQNAHTLFDTTLVHELAHLRTAAVFTILPGTPPFAEEGIALSSQPQWSKRDTALWLKGLREKGRLIPASKLVALATYPEDPELNNAMYSEGLAPSVLVSK